MSTYGLLCHNIPAAEELDNFAHILEMEGVIVRRPEVRPRDFARPVSTPDFESKSQLYAAMPRDVLIVVSVPASRPYDRDEESRPLGESVSVGTQGNEPHTRAP